MTNFLYNVAAGLAFVASTAAFGYLPTDDQAIMPLLDSQEVREFVATLSAGSGDMIVRITAKWRDQFERSAEAAEREIAACDQRATSGAVDNSEGGICKAKVRGNWLRDRMLLCQRFEDAIADSLPVGNRADWSTLARGARRRRSLKEIIGWSNRTQQIADLSSAADVLPAAEHSAIQQILQDYERDCDVVLRLWETQYPTLAADRQINGMRIARAKQAGQDTKSFDIAVRTDEGEIIRLAMNYSDLCRNYFNNISKVLSADSSVTFEIAVGSQQFPELFLPTPVESAFEELRLVQQSLGANFQCIQNVYAQFRVVHDALSLQLLNEVRRVPITPDTVNDDRPAANTALAVCESIQLKRFELVKGTCEKMRACLTAEQLAGLPPPARVALRSW